MPGYSPHHNNSVWSQSPERSLLSSCLVNRTSCLDRGRGRPFICFHCCLKRSWGNWPYETGSFRSVIVNSVHLMSTLASRNTYVVVGNNRRRGTSNDSDYYYCSKDVGEVVHQPHAVFFLLMFPTSPVICHPSDRCVAWRIWSLISPTHIIQLEVGSVDVTIRENVPSCPHFASLAKSSI